MYKAEMQTAGGTVYTAYADTPYDALTALLEDGHDWRQISIKPARLSERLHRQEAANECDH